MISQREASRLRKQVRTQADKIRELEWKLREYRRLDPSEGKQIFEQELVGGNLVWAIQTAQTLGHVVIARQRGNSIQYRALPLPAEVA